MIHATMFLRRLNPKQVDKYLGRPKVFQDELLKNDEIGVATGLAWTATGGDILFVEATAMKGKGGLALTGQLGDVMKESAHAAMSYARSHATDFGIDEDFFAGNDIHVHVPEGAIPKDGPSAGVTMATAMISMLVGKPVHRNIAMTGEITLRGEVLPVGGIKEKVLAARRAKIRSVILPALNERDLEDVNEELRREMRFVFVGRIHEVFAEAIITEPKPLPKRSTPRKKTAKKEPTKKKTKKKAAKRSTTESKKSAAKRATRKGRR